jgi:tRNA dimethylallyltransferase
MVGPTAVGKTSTSIRLAQRFDGEIVSADSRQFYRGMDIGTAKATAAEQAAVPHYMLDICQPSETLTLAEFQQQAYAHIADITARGELPFLVGGTGLYVRAVAEGYGIPRVPPDEALRAELLANVSEEGQAALHARLQQVDSEAAEKIHPHNVRRVVRALEVYLKSGIPISVHQRKSPPPYRILQLGLIRPREQLYQRVAHRIEAMLAAGWIAEVQTLLATGLSPKSPAMSALGYRETVAFLGGEIPTQAELATQIGYSTHRFIRKQANWFSQNDPKIHWFDLDTQQYEEIEAFVERWLRE